jgi:hypothetical protein
MKVWVVGAGRGIRLLIRHCDAPLFLQEFGLARVVESLPLFGWYTHAPREIPTVRLSATTGVHC